jgi:hypothetical protein
MTVIFDYEATSVYIENPDPRATEDKIFYYQYKGADKQHGRSTVNLMRRMYELGRQHKLSEIQKILGVIE